MKLTITERSTTFGLLPQKEEFDVFNLILEARKVLAFTDEENTALGVVVEDLGGGKIMTRWSDKVAEEIGEVEIPLGQVVTVMITKKLKELNDKKEIDDKTISLYEKFVVNKDKE